MPVEHLRARDRVARPWRNGGGITRDVAVFPEGASDEDFLWRASLATIAAAGPFSTWPGVDRTLMLLEGQLLVAIDGEMERRLRPADPAIEFAGEAAVAARPGRDACTVLNIMGRRGRMRTRVDRRRDVHPTAADQILMLAEAPMSISLEGRPVSLEKHDGLLLDRSAFASLESDRTLVIAELFAAA